MEPRVVFDAEYFQAPKLTFPSGKVVDCRHTDVYALLQGPWKAVWSQATQLPPDASPEGKTA